mmetsp:Transcript_5606/g.14190  ORF Transcript_5606/g.14190 Transcript_5606/m.14190 type:complete len:429 (-) Transcript_5606:26-1312(-)
MRRVVLAAMAAAVRAGRVVVVGGGASGFFAAITAARRGAETVLVEATRKPLKKVLASGGGRCNVIHDPTMAVTDIVERYPRGRREIRGPFTSLFGPEDMRRWFEAEGVELKTEADGRVFPVTDDSQTVADALRNAAQKAGVSFRGGAAATTIDVAGAGFAVKTGDDAYDAAAVILATGSAPGGYALAKALGHEPFKPCPSLFSFRVKSPVLEGLAGLSVPDARVELKGAKKKPPPPTRGPLLVTHRGLSGPAALRLSAFKARELQDCGYKGTLVADLLPDASPGAVRSTLDAHKKMHAGATVAGATRPFAQLPKRLWARLVAHANVREGCRWGDASARELDAVAAACSALELDFDGKDTNKEEFVTAGGVRLKEINFKTYESKSVPGLHFCGELVDVDGVTGGFNFMHCWCSGFAAGTSAAAIAEGVS